MSAPTPDEPSIGDVIEPTEQTHPDHRAHGKIPKRVSGAELENRLEHERETVGAEDEY
jgi:hypothetical protein